MSGIAHCYRVSLQGERLGQLGFACPTTSIHFVSGVVVILVSLIEIKVGVLDHLVSEKGLAIGVTGHS